MAKGWRERILDSYAELLGSHPDGDILVKEIVPRRACIARRSMTTSSPSMTSPVL